MFDINSAIDAWCREIIELNCAGRDKLDELKDHMHCLVEEEIARGADERSAFAAAARQMGDSNLISAEYAKNTSLLRKIAAYDRKLPGRLMQRFSARQLTLILLGGSLCFAAAMITATWLTGEAGWAMWLLAVWFVPFTAIASVPAVRRAECNWLRRLIGRHTG